MARYTGARLQALPQGWRKIILKRPEVLYAEVRDRKKGFSSRQTVTAE